MRYTPLFIVITMLLYQCKAKDHLASKTNESSVDNSDLLMSSKNDTIYGHKHDTVIVSLPVEFTKGRFWSQGDTSRQLAFFTQDEVQQYDGNHLKDFQRFYYICQDTGASTLTYHLRSPIGRDTNIYASQSKYFIIK